MRREREKKEAADRKNAREVIEINLSSMYNLLDKLARVFEDSYKHVISFLQLDHRYAMTTTTTRRKRKGAI